YERFGGGDRETGRECGWQDFFTHRVVLEIEASLPKSAAEAHDVNQFKREKDTFLEKKVKQGHSLSLDYVVRAMIFASRLYPVHAASRDRSDFCLMIFIQCKPSPRHANEYLPPGAYHRRTSHVGIMKAYCIKKEHEE
ncbi:hypothetical protein NDU88_005443, partial [Pleurodeles waltl]